MAIPMLLLSCDIRKIGREAGKILIIFMIGAIGTSVGAILGFKVLGNHVKDLAGVAAMMTGSYIGGTVKLRCNGKCISGTRRHNIRSGCSG